MSVNVTSLSPGQFIGSRRRSLATCGTTLAEFQDQGEAVPLHSHDDAHFILVLRGRYRTDIARGTTTDGNVLIFNPSGTTHRDHFVERGGRFFSISLMPDHFDRLSSSRGSAKNPEIIRDGPVRWSALQLYRYMVLGDGGWSEMMDEWVITLVGQLDRYCVVTGRGGAPSWMETATSFINDCLTERLSVTKVASEAGVHPYHLSRTFRRHLGMSVIEFIRNARVERAEQMLSRGTLPLTQVALGCGYADQSQFSKAFRRVTGTTPGAYRARVARG